MRILTAVFTLMIAVFGDAALAEASPPPSFMAAEFFETVHASVKRKADLPKKVDLDKVTVTQSELEDLLLGNWRVQMSCGGYPIRLDDFRSTGYYNGIEKEAPTLNFFEDRYEQVLLRGLHQSTDVPARKVSNEGEWYVVNIDDDGKFDLYYENLARASLRVERIRQTGELVIINSKDTWRGYCPNGERSFTVYSKVPTS